MDDFGSIEDFKKGDASAFEVLLLKYKDRIYTLCRYLLEDPHDADDAAQDTFVKAFQGLKRFIPSASFYTWLYRIAVNTCKNRLKSSQFRHRKRMVPLYNPGNGESRNPAVNIRDERLTPNALLLEKEKMMLIQKAIDALPEEQKSVIILRDVEGLSYDEVSTITGYPLGTVKSKLARARLGLGNMLRGVI
jgi:RNA polymerase sigma-70 factor (ECF subfamily)